MENNSSDESDIKNIMNIYLLNENNSNSWNLFYNDISEENPNEKIFSYIKNKINEEPNNELNCDIIDYIIDKGSNLFIDKIFQQDFFDLLTDRTIENNKENLEIKEKSLFLIKKWVNKFNDKYKTLTEKYNKYKNDGILFPEKTFKTYDKYIKINIKNNEENKDLNYISEMKKHINSLPKEVNLVEVKESKTNVENNNNDYTNNNNEPAESTPVFKALENPFEENNDNLLENLDFPDDEQFDNKFSDIRTSEIPTYFKTLRNKSIVENSSQFIVDNEDIPNDYPNNINEITNEKKINEEQKDGTENNDNKKDDKKTNNEQKPKNPKISTNMNDILKTKKTENYTSTYKNYRNDPLLFENKWKEKISECNKWIKEGKNSLNFENLKEGIMQILIGLDEIEEIINTCAKIGDDDGRNKVSYIKSDMEQTCYRYECLIQGKKVEKFKSAFDGNVKKYYFYKPGLLEEKNININVIKDEKKEKKMNKIGRAIKNGFFKVGQKIKSKSKSKDKKHKNIGNIGLSEMTELEDK